MPGIPEREVWEEIGKGWSGWRNRMLQEVSDFRSRHLPDSGRVIDIGGGNGRNLRAFDGWERVNVDFSGTILGNCPCVLADMRSLPFRDSEFDAALMINSVHCLPGGREKAMSEAFRILRAGGKILVSAWNRWEMRFFPSNLLSGNVRVPWKRKGREVMRFYHLFTKKELESLVSSAGFVVIESFKGWDARESWFVVAQKP